MTVYVAELNLTTSATVTVKLHVVVFPAPSVAVLVTVVVPTGNVEPEGGLNDCVTPGQLSLDEVEG